MGLIGERSLPPFVFIEEEEGEGSIGKGEGSWGLFAKRVVGERTLARELRLVGSLLYSKQLQSNPGAELRKK